MVSEQINDERFEHTMDRTDWDQMSAELEATGDPHAQTLAELIQSKCGAADGPIALDFNDTDSQTIFDQYVTWCEENQDDRIERADQLAAEIGKREGMSIIGSAITTIYNRLRPA